MWLICTPYYLHMRTRYLVPPILFLTDARKKWSSWFLEFMQVSYFTSRVCSNVMNKARYIVWKQRLLHDFQASSLWKCLSLESNGTEFVILFPKNIRHFPHCATHFSTIDSVLNIIFTKKRSITIENTRSIIQNLLYLFSKQLTYNSWKCSPYFDDSNGPIIPNWGWTNCFRSNFFLLNIFTRIVFCFFLLF